MSEQSPPYHEALTFSPEELLASPFSSYWLKDALRAALDRDPVDAAHDAELLSLVLGARADASLGIGAPMVIPVSCAEQACTRPETGSWANSSRSALLP